jgi:hypothetical protein
MLFYLSARRLPYEGIDDWIEQEGDEEAEGDGGDGDGDGDGNGGEGEGGEGDDSMTIVYRESLSPLLEGDAVSVSTAADAYIAAAQDMKQKDGSQSPSLFLDVGAGKVSILLRSNTAGDPSIMKIELDGKQVTDRTVCLLDGNTSLVEFSGGVGGRVSILAL